MEKWKDIKGYKGIYQVSNFGRIKSLKKTIKDSRKRTYSLKEKIMKPYIRQKYPSINLCKIIDGKGSRRAYYIHRLMAKVFIPNPKNKPQVNHKNGLTTDNRISNIEWCTSIENVRHAIKNGLRDNKGENYPNAKLKKYQVIKILELYKTNKYLMTEIAKIYKVDKSTIWYIVKRKSWKHINNNS